VSVIWLNSQSLQFPDPESSESKDVIAVGGDLSVERLVAAYRLGIFPWYNADEPILWWSPDPRMVLFPDELKIAKSMRPLFNQNKFKVTYNVDFQGIMRACAGVNRHGQDGSSWIHNDMVNAYLDLHRRGYAHSVEVWQGTSIVGGLYGVAIGKVFFGESMFALAPNASKFGFISFVQKLKGLGFQLIDCQQETQHLGSLGGRLIDRDSFMTLIRANANEAQITI
jgi:leucyl/phenylalanyl-tRNA---protein transferase